MEHTTAAGVVPLDVGWSDVGSWSALWGIAPHDDHENAVIGDVVAVNTRKSYLRAESRLVAAIGLENLVIVETRDAVLVAPRDQSQRVKELVEFLKLTGREEAERHRAERRPWGRLEVLAAGTGFQVRRLDIDPGGKLSLRSHRHRAEEWLVVTGTALVTIDDETSAVEHGGTVTLPVGSVHRLENPGPGSLVVVEVQLGAHLSEDDIERHLDERERS